MAALFFVCEPYDKSALTLALESGVDGIVVRREYAEQVAKLARTQVLALEDVNFVELSSKKDEEDALALMRDGKLCVLRHGWEVIPVENLLAQSEKVFVEAHSLEQAKLACGILEKGVAGIFLSGETLLAMKTIVATCKVSQKHEELCEASITKIVPVGLGHRVCVDTLSLFSRGQGMLCGNSSGFTFLVHAETEHNEYVASRPFRINAGGVHAYARLAHDRTCYLSELRAGDEVLICRSDGETSLATVGRVKIEVRPMLMIEAELEGKNGLQKGTIFLQNAETIRLTEADGTPISVVSLKKGDKVLCRLDALGRHFGMRVSEDIKEI